MFAPTRSSSLIIILFVMKKGRALEGTRPWLCSRSRSRRRPAPHSRYEAARRCPTRRGPNGCRSSLCPAMLARLGFRKGRVFKKDRKGDDNKFEATLYLSWPGQARPDIANEGT